LKKSVLVLAVVIVSLGFAAGWTARSTSSRIAAQTPGTLPLFTTHLYRFEIRPDGKAALDRWVQFEKAHHEETLATLEDEAMYFEGVFPDDTTHPHYLYWVAVNGKENPHATPKPIDDQFRKLEKETLVNGSRMELLTAYVLIPPFIEHAIREHDDTK